MDTLSFKLSFLALLPLLLVYFFNYSRFYDAINRQRPEWLRYKGEPSVFYANLPRRFDANVSVRVLGIAFSGRAKQLDAGAYRHARAMRIALPLYVVAFGIVVWSISIGA